MPYKITIEKNDAKKPLRGLNKRYVKAWIVHCLKDFLPAAEVHVDFVNAKTSQALNTHYRAKNHPTNILSFPLSSPPVNQYPLLGNLILCTEVIEKEAKAQKKTVPDHLAHLLIHGCLHLLGYDHQKTQEAKIMERLEINFLKKIGIRNPYA